MRGRCKREEKKIVLKKCVGGPVRVRLDVLGMPGGFL